MKNKHYFILCLLSLVLVSCNNNYIGKKYDTKKYTVAEGGILDRFYTADDNKIIELPYLPYGFYLFYDDQFLWSDSSSNNKQLPLLGHQDFFGNEKSSVKYPIENVSSVVINNDALYVTANGTFYEIKFNEPFNYQIVDNIKYEESSIIFNFAEELINDFNYTENCFSLQSNDINKKYNVNYSTPVINGIISLGLYDDEFYFGQTMYSYFIIDLKTDKLSFFRNETEFNNFCRDNIKHSVDVLYSSYFYMNSGL